MPTTTTNAKTCTYKGKTYRLLFLGQTKFGRKAKLSFLDGSKEFWVMADTVGGVASATAAPTASNPRRRSRGEEGRCWECGCTAPLDDDGQCGQC